MIRPLEHDDSDRAAIIASVLKPQQQICGGNRGATEKEAGAQKLPENSAGSVGRLPLAWPAKNHGSCRFSQSQASARHPSGSLAGSPSEYPTLCYCFLFSLCGSDGGPADTGVRCHRRWENVPSWESPTAKNSAIEMGELDRFDSIGRATRDAVRRPRIPTS
jgi:hypothetical protein